MIDSIVPGAILSGPFWKEPIKVISVRELAGKTIIRYVGLISNMSDEQILSPEDLAKVKMRTEAALEFSGDPEGFFLSVEAWRIHYAYQFDPLYAVNVSQIDPLPHQIDAVYNYVLRNPSIRFLLADDPGAGKTIMAGLVMKELKYRGLVERVLVIVPGHLKDQWLREMKTKFQESLAEVNRAVVNAYWGRNIWKEETQIITSIDFLKQEDVLLSVAETKWDLVLVDEAHKMSAYQYGRKTAKTERYRLGEIISRSTNYLVFLTATPHRGDPDNFRLFLDLLQPGFFATNEMLAQSIDNKDNPLFLRRLKEDLKNFDGTPLFPPRQVKTVKYRLSDEEKILYNAVTEYVEKHYQKALAKDKRNVTFALLILQRRLASSVRAIRKSLERRRSRLDELLKQGKIIQEQGFVDEDVLEDYSEMDRWREEDELLEKLTSAETLEELDEEIHRLDELVELAKEAEKKEVETKLTELRKMMDILQLKDKEEKLLVFTESKDTLEYLVEKLRTWGYSVNYIHGGMNLDKRIEAESEFRNRTQVMVATEAAGEGINLQFCWLMVNYDIPWNPNRLEQRMGRIHRYGQQNEVYIYNLVAVDTREGRILDRLFEKLERMREHLGSDRIFDVIGDAFPGRSLKDLIVEAISNKRTLEEILEDFDRIPDQAVIQKVKEATMESLATRHIDLRAILGETRRAKENRLVPEYIEQFFKRAADRLNVTIEHRKDGFLRLTSVPFEFRNQSVEFRNKYGEVFKEYNKFSFDKERSFREQAEFVAPGHPLMEAVVAKVLEQFESDTQRGALFHDAAGNMEGLLWFLESEVKDGKGQIAGRRIFALFQNRDGEILPVSPAILWDLKPADSGTHSPSFPVNAQQDKVTIYAVENIVSNYLQELKSRRERDAEVKRKYGLRSLDILIAKSEEKLLDYETRRAKGEQIPDPVLINERRSKEDLDRKRKRLTEEIEAEINLLPSVPRIKGVAAVIPAPSVSEEAREDKEIELIGMRVATEYELKEGRAPEDVSKQNLGFDIRSLGQDSAVRYIEVKARSRTGSIALTPNEWLMAHRLREEYWLYVVENATTKPELYLINDPAKQLKPDQEIEIVRYVVRAWKPLSTRAN
jgi:superfamily II DNA or RNA helicase